MYRDDELPGGFQDADFEMRDLEAIGQVEDMLKKRGICTHGWMNHNTCLDCGRTFDNVKGAAEERGRILGEYL